MLKQEPFSLKDFFILFGLLFIALVPRLFLLYFKGDHFFFMEEIFAQSIFGLMGKHILEGHPMVYLYNQGYMGSIEAMMAAFFYLFRGINVLSLQLGVLTFYILFIVTNFVLLKKVFGRTVSGIANVFLVISPPFLTLMNLSAWGGYNETLFFGSLTLLGFIFFLELKNTKVILFLTGFVAGIGFWTHNLILMYFFSIALFWILKTSFWKELRTAAYLKRIFFLESFKTRLPSFLRWACILVHCGILLFILWNITSCFLGEKEWGMGGIHLKTAFPPFHVKTIKKIVVWLLVETSTLLFFNRQFFSVWASFKKVFPLGVGFLVGTIPVHYHSLFDGSGYRQIHGSGMILAGQFPSAFHQVIWKNGWEGILGINITSLFQFTGFSTFQSWGMLLSLSGLLVYFIFQKREEIGRLFRLYPYPYSYEIFPFLMSFMVLAICLFNNIGISNKRYLTPLYFTLSLIFALAISRIKQRSSIMAYFLALLLIANNVYANFYILNQRFSGTHMKDSLLTTIKVLEKAGVRGAYAHCDVAYPLTFISQEKIKVGAYRSMNSIPSYVEYVDQLNKVAYLFLESDHFRLNFQKLLGQNQISYKKESAGNLWIYIIDRSIKSEKKIVPFS